MAGADVLDFTGWLRAHNDALPSEAPRVCFHGLDTITTRERPEGHVTHAVTSPTKVMLEETEEGAHEALKVEAADGTTGEGEGRAANKTRRAGKRRVNNDDEA